MQFYKEREWRYVPKNCDVPTYKRISERRKKQLNKTLYNSNKANVFVKFEYDEIEHIILPNKVEATSMLNFFKTLKINGRKLKEIEKLKLAQKVIDLEPIDLDF